MPMKDITTVLGRISPEELGFCQCHEHILLSRGKSYELNPALCMDNISKSIAELNRYRLAGGTSIVDAQPIGCNRMTEELAFISEASGVHIVSSTGFHKLSFYPDSHWIHTIDAKNLARIFMLELTDGMFTDTEYRFPCAQCHVRSGIIKTALDTEGLTPRYQKLFGAAASASARTGRPIMIHVEQNADPLPLLDFLSALGINGNHMIFCHLDRACADFDVHLKIAAAKAYLEYDTIGRFKYHSNEHELCLIQSLIRNGYEKQLLISLDTTAERLKSYCSNAVGLDYILNTFIPLMHSHNITENQTRLFTYDNPMCALSGTHSLTIPMKGGHHNEPHTVSNSGKENCTRC